MTINAPTGRVQGEGAFGHILPDETTSIGNSVLSAKRIAPQTTTAPSKTIPMRSRPLAVSFFLTKRLILWTYSLKMLTRAFVVMVAVERLLQQCHTGSASKTLPPLCCLRQEILRLEALSGTPFVHDLPRLPRQLASIPSLPYCAGEDTTCRRLGRP